MTDYENSQIERGNQHPFHQKEKPTMFGILVFLHVIILMKDTFLFTAHHGVISMSEKFGET